MSEEYQATLESYAEVDEGEILYRAGLGTSRKSCGFSGVAKALSELGRQLDVAGLETVARCAPAGRRVSGTVRSSEATRIEGTPERQLQALVRELERPAPIGLAARVEDATAFREAHRLLTLAGPAGNVASYRPQCVAAVHRLHAAARAGAVRLAVAETTLLTEKVSRAMVRIGYSSQVRLAPDRRRAIVRGLGRDGTAVFLRLDPLEGRLDADFAGFEGHKCEAARQRLQEALEAEGVRLRIVRAGSHGRKTGSALANSASSLFESEPAPREADEVRPSLPPRLRVG